MSVRAQARRRRVARRRKVLAVLAAGAVFGVGAAGTLAAWTDTENGQGTVTAGRFGIQGSVLSTPTEASYTDHGEGNPGTLVFAPAATAMFPGQSTYTTFTVRTTAQTNVPGTVRLEVPSGANASGLAPSLEYRVRAIGATAACDAAVFANQTGVAVVGEPLVHRSRRVPLLRRP